MTKSKGFEKQVTVILDSVQSELEKSEHKFNRIGGTLAIECNETTDKDITDIIKCMVGSVIEKPFEKVCKLNTHNKRLFLRFKREVHC